MNVATTTRTAVLLGVTTALALTGCSTGNSTASTSSTTAAGSASSSAAAAPCTIGMSQINQTAVFFTQMNEGATAAAKEVGCELTIANANNDSAKQNSDIESFVTQNLTAIVVVAIDVNGVLPAVKAARAKGIKVVAIDAKLEDGSVETFVGVDNSKAGEQIGQWMVDKGLAKDKTYGVVDAKNSFIQNQREDAFRKVMDAAGAKYTQSVSGDNVQEKAAAAAQNLVTAQKDLDVVYTTGEPATVGAAAALKPTGKTKIVGWDLTKEVIAAVDSGLVTAVVQQDPKKEGEEAVKELKAILGGAAPKGFIDVPITIVTKENVEPYRAIFP
ncbi:substrate-binding domain-containing protein [Kineosporia sp. A_224]|uniref:substrate-binding domain-containing protein n=1 Tax=Kineosporia sp. A_224 TaxID=1962180 RepID=UPI000B4B6379|nr:substrate-binding domain-containing protein [Kineosporia sp. A_224]